MEPQQPDYDEKPNPPWLRVVLQVGLGCLLTAALLPLLVVAANFSESLGLALRSANRLDTGLNPVIALFAFGLGGVLAARLSATLAGKPWDGVLGCVLAAAVGWYVWPRTTAAMSPHDALLFAMWPAGLLLGYAVAALVIQRRGPARLR